MNARTSLVALALVACGASSVGEGASYLDDASFRRATLEASLVNPANAYSQLRLARYGREWERLPEWNPPVEPVDARELDAPGGAALAAAIGRAAPLVIDAAALAADPEALRALGEAAFARYPVQLAEEEATALRSREDARRYGVWTDDARGVGGLVRVALARGVGLARTCATCHVGARGDALVTGAPNERLDLGRMISDVAPPSDPELRARVLAWGPGRIDVTTRTALEPVRIPDLRPTRWLTHLHADGTVKQSGIAALALRIETLVVTSHAETIRPPRVVALALAAYVWSLADALPSRAPIGDERRGEAYFARTCAGCHAPPAFTGAPVDLAFVGTDPTVGLSSDRGTGKYRVPSLRGVATRGPLLHDGSCPDLETLFDPARLDDGFRGSRRGGAIPGHAFGLDAEPSERAALVAYLRTL